MKLENISWLEKEQDGKGTTYTFKLVDAPHITVKRKVGYMLSGNYGMFESGHFRKEFKTEHEVIEYIKKYITK